MRGSRSSKISFLFESGMKGRVIPDELLVHELCGILLGCLCFTIKHRLINQFGFYFQFAS